MNDTKSTSESQQNERKNPSSLACEESRTSQYLLGSSQEEMQRLGIQHQVWLAETVDLWDRAGFGNGDRLIDLGCGPGFASLDLVSRVGPSGHVTAIDNAPRYIEALKSRAQQLGMTQLDVEIADVARFTFRSDSYDGVFVRWLLCFLPNPRNVLERLADAIRPGGTVVVLDYFNYLAVAVQPPDDECRQIFETYDRSVRKLAGSFDVGGFVPRWLEELDFTVEHLIPIQKVGRPGSVIWDWVSSFHASHLPELNRRGFIDGQTMSRFQKAWDRVSRQPGTFFFTPPMIGIVARRRD